MRRHIFATYEKVKGGVGENPESPRKRFCLAYLEFKVKLDDESKEKYVDAAKEFRKAERKVGRTHRTKLEKLARKHFYAVAKRKRLKNSWKAGAEYAQGQYERGEGIFSPEQIALRAERNRETWRRYKETGFHPHMKNWVITDPDGNTFVVRSLEGFANQVGIWEELLRKTAQNRRNMHYGYKAAYYDPEFHTGLKFLDWKQLPPFDPKQGRGTVRLSDLVDWDALPYVEEVFKGK